MIISSDAPHSPAKNGNSSLPAASNPETAPPPAYGAIESSTSSRRPYPQPIHYQSQPTLLPVVNRRQSPGRRFFKALGVALLIWFLVLALTRSMKLSVSNQSDTGGFSIPSNVHVEDCIQGESQWPEHSSSSNGLPGGLNSEYPYSARAKYELPVSSETIFLVAKGALSRGQVQIVTSPLLTDSIVVDVVGQYYNSGALDHVKVCTLRRNGSKDRGIGIFTPNWWQTGISRRYQSFFHLTVTIPEGSDSVLHIKAFETDMSNYYHVVGDLEGRVYFDKLQLKTSNNAILGESILFKDGLIQSSNGQIKLQLVSAERNATIQTSNSPILGRYISAADLTLKTSNALIKVDATFGKYQSPATFEAITSNGRLQVDIHTPAKESKIVLRTSNGPVYANLQDLPLGATTDINGRTSNSIIDFAIPATYEGSYSLVTSNASPYVERHSNPKDPAGKNRERQIVTDGSAKGTSSGKLYWDAKNKALGAIKLISSNARIVLRV